MIDMLVKFFCAATVVLVGWLVLASIGVLIVKVVELAV